MKLYAIAENADGKEVRIGSNERISVTLYDGNKKAYSVYIEWGDIGDVIDNDGNELPESEKTKGATVTTREWRNQPDEKRIKGDKLQGECNHACITSHDDMETCDKCGHTAITID